MNPLAIQSLTLGALLFVMGFIGFLTRRNLILMFLSLELMLTGATINFVTFANQAGNVQGQFFAILILTVASCEAALALALIVSLFRLKNNLDIFSWTELREVVSTENHYPKDETSSDTTTSKFPELSVAGRDPLLVMSPAKPE